jgi:hypothetical protein
MVMVTGIMRGAAVAVITTVGTEAADIIMDGTGADIADGIHKIHQGRLESGAALICHDKSFNRTECGRCSTRGYGQAARGSIATFGAFEDFLGDVPRTRCSSAPIERP